VDGKCRWYAALHSELSPAKGELKEIHIGLKMLSKCKSMITLGLGPLTTISCADFLYCCYVARKGGYVGDNSTWNACF
jgi:hypothetical protein